MSEISAREWRFYLDDMVTFAEKVLVYSESCEREAFFCDSMRCDATVRNLELIGEAATRIPEAVRNAHPEIPWRLIIATRNRLIHGYLGIDRDTVWSIIRDEIPTLVQTLRKVREEVHRS